MQVNISKLIDTPEGNRYCPVVVGPNGRIKPDWVIVNDALRAAWSPSNENSDRRQHRRLGRPPISAIRFHVDFDLRLSCEDKANVESSLRADGRGSSGNLYRTA
jgi:hypothetical protein